MTEEEKALFNAAITLAQYCKTFEECTRCIFYTNDGCGIDCPAGFRIPAALCEKKE